MATRKPFMRWIIAAAVLLLFIVAIFVLESTLTLDTAQRWALRVGFVLLGLIAAGSIVWYLRPQDEEPKLDPGDDILLVIGGARARLPKKSFANRAVVLMLGPEGSTKSTLVGRSGGDPELLGGDAVTKPGEVPPPTKTANVWAMQQAIVVELAASLLSDAKRWAKVVRGLRAPRVSAAMAQGDVAARAAVVCVPCDLFYAGGNGQQLAQLGVTLRQRLAEASRELGLAMPVYVVFTKMDRVPHFESWIGPFTKDELRAPLGATLAMDPQADSGNYAERLTPRIEAAYRQIADTLAARRVDVLGRDTVQEHRYGAYELPREWRKLAPSVTTFLIELCRPTQLGSSPQLRGFYFTGARPVVVSDVAQAPAARPAAAAATADATMMFRQSMQPAAAAAAATPTARKVPEWVFQERLLRDVVLADTGAQSVASGGVRVQSTRRIAFGVAIAASVLLLLGVTISWLGNRALANRVAEAARGVSALPVVQSSPGTIAFPSADALRRLDALREQLEVVRSRINDGPPWRLRFGLWQGQALLDAARPVYYEGFRRQLFAAGWGAMVDSLKALPEIPTTSNDYGVTYSWLKSYLITTTTPDSSTAAFLAPVLLTSWQRGQQVGEDINGLARRQYEFYATELPSHNPFPTAADAALVRKSRDFLGRFTGGEQIYRNMLAAADKQVPPVPVPQAPGILTTTKEVAGSFTTKGAAFMADAFRNADKYFQTEAWVVGDATAAKGVDREAVISSIRAKYFEGYTKAWQQVIQSAVVVNPTSVKDGADKLDIISGTQSPILQVLRTAATNTATDSAMRAVFQPVHAVTPPEVLDKYVSEKNQPYMDGLLGLAAALRQLTMMPPPVDTQTTLDYVKAAQAATGDVSKARVAEKKVAQNFTLTPAAAPLATAVERLLIAPINGAEAVLRTAQGMKPPVKRIAAAPAPAAPAPGGGGGGGGDKGAAIAAGLNERGRALCSMMTPILAKFPFNPDSPNDASTDEVTALLAPGTGEIWAFQKERLEPFLEKQGGKYVGKPVGNVALSASFVEFFNKAVSVSNALFYKESPKPALSWMARGITSSQTPQILLRNGGRVAKFDASTPRNEVVWPAEGGRDAKLEATFKKNKPVTVASASGEWALFRLVYQARFDGAGHAEFNAPTGKDVKDAVPVVVEFDALNAVAGVPVLKRGWLGGMTCVAQVTQ